MISRPWKNNVADTLIIHGLTAQCRIGVSEAEQASPQQLWIDLELEIDAARAAAKDDVHAAVDYAELVGAVRTLAESRTVALLETLAEEIASAILERFGTDSVTVRVKKRALPGMDYAAVEIERGR